jgi:hypothetical protein
MAKSLAKFKRNRLVPRQFATRETSLALADGMHLLRSRHAMDLMNGRARIELNDRLGSRHGITIHSLSKSKSHFGVSLVSTRCNNQPERSRWRSPAPRCARWSPKT